MRLWGITLLASTLALGWLPAKAGSASPVDLCEVNPCLCGDCELPEYAPFDEGFPEERELMVRYGGEEEHAAASRRPWSLPTPQPFT